MRPRFLRWARLSLCGLLAALVWPRAPLAACSGRTVGSQPGGAPAPSPPDDGGFAGSFPLPPPSDDGGEVPRGALDSPALGDAGDDDATGDGSVAPGANSPPDGACPQPLTR